MQHVENIQYVYLLNKYLKCSVWRLALRYDIYIYMSLGFRRLSFFLSKYWAVNCGHDVRTRTSAFDFQLWGVFARVKVRMLRKTYH